MKNRLKNYSYFFKVRKLQIPFIIFVFILGFVVGFFAVPQKYAYQAHCMIDKDKGASLQQTAVANGIISEEHLSGLANYIEDSNITSDSLRKTISLDIVLTESIFAVTFSVSKQDLAKKIGYAFENFSISFLNENVTSFRRTLQINKTNYYKTNTFSKEFLSGVLSSICAGVFFYFAILTINLLPLNKNKDMCNENC